MSLLPLQSIRILIYVQQLVPDDFYQYTCSENNFAY